MEYQDHVSQSVFVKFPVVGQPKTFIVIWTTTPWTLPANLAVAYNKDFQYVSVKVGDENYIVFRGSAAGGGREMRLDELHRNAVPRRRAACANSNTSIRSATAPARLFAGDIRHSDTGTGFVHIAPGHGLDDYNLGRAERPADLLARWMTTASSLYTNDLPVEQQMPAEMVGKSILEKHGKSDANEAVLHELRARHALLHQENYHHSYPHCWRSKTPIIFRAMDQWFIKIDHVVRRQASPPVCMPDEMRSRDRRRRLSATATFRERALAEIDRVNWIPDWGVNRIKGAVQSPARLVHLAASAPGACRCPRFMTRKGKPSSTRRSSATPPTLIEQHGSNVWFEKSAAELWSLVKPTDWKGAGSRRQIQRHAGRVD